MRFELLERMFRESGWLAAWLDVDEEPTTTSGLDRSDAKGSEKAGKNGDQQWDWMPPFPPF